MSAETPTVIVFCPACGARYAIAESFVANAELLVLCTACGKGSRLGDIDPERAAATTDALGLALTEALQPRVIVGHEVPAAARSIADILRRGGFAPVCVRTGDEVLAAVDPTMPSQPSAVVLDVGIPGVLAFEIIEALRSSASSSVPVVLLASVYERTRYKRRPNRLYGADAYLELHHVPDRLVEVLQGLLTKSDAVDERKQAPVDRARAAPLRLNPPTVDGEGARSLARRLLSDVALYHGDEIAQGIRVGAPFSLIEDAVAAARDLHQTAGGSSSIFNDEVQAFASRLSAAKAVGGKQIA
jgi:predicted Zn finger-like uncharacterized protein